MRALRIVLIGLLGLLLMAAGLWLFREPLVAYAFQRWAEAQGLEAELAELDLGLQRLKVQGLRLAELEIKQAEVSFAADRLLRGEVDRIDIEGLYLPLDLAGDGPPLGALQALLERAEEEPEGWKPLLPLEPPALPAIFFKDSQVLLRTSQGPLPLKLQGAFSPDAADGSGELRVSFQAEGPAGLAAVGRLEASLIELHPERLTAEVVIDWQDRAAASLVLTSGSVPQGKAVELTARLQGGAPELAALLPVIPEVASGRLDLTTEATLLLPSLPYLESEPPASWLEWLGEREVTARLHLAGQQLDIPSYASDLTLFGAFFAAQEEEGLFLRLEGPLELHASALGPTLREALPELLSHQFEGGASLSAHAHQSLPLVALHHDEGLQSAAGLSLDLAEQTHVELLLEASAPLPLASVRLSLDKFDVRSAAFPFLKNLQLEGQGEFELLAEHANGKLQFLLAGEEFLFSDLAAKKVQLAATLGLDRRGNDFELVLQEPASLAMAALAGPGAGIREQLDVTLSSLALKLELEDELRGTIDAEAHTRPPPVLLEGLGALQAADLALTLEATFDGPGPSGGTATVVGSSLRLIQQQITLADFRLEAPFAPDQPLLKLPQGRLYSGAQPALFPPLNLSGQLDRQLNFDFTGSGAGGAIRLTARGRHDAAADMGQAFLELAPLRFAPGGLQPSVLGSSVADISSATGSLAASSRLNWSSGRFDGSLRLSGQDLGFSYAGTLLEGINFDFRLASLRPPRTAEPQRMTIRRVEPGVTPLTDVTLLLSVESDRAGNPILRLEEGEGKVTGGRIRVIGGSADPGAARYSALLELERLDLASLLELIGLEDLTGSGRISGRIPIELQGESLSVDQGLLQAEGPGVLALRSPEARSALAAGGDYVALMFDALENFQYEKLEIGLSKPLSGTTQIRLRLLGANPDVLDGQPFDLNINVQTNAAPLLEALAESRRLQQDVTEQLRRLVR